MIEFASGEILRGPAAVLRSALAKNGKWASGVAAVAGFVADVLQPVAPFAAYVFLLGAVACLVLATVLFARLLAADRAAPALVFALFVTVVSGGLWQMQRAEAAEDGVVASVVPAVADLQRRLGLVAADVASVRQTVEGVAERVARIEEGVGAAAGSVEGLKASAETTGQIVRHAAAATDRVETRVAAVAESQRRVEETARSSAERAARSADKIASVADRLTTSIDDMTRSFQALSQAGGLVADPKTAAEIYHNARLTESRGDALAARRAYLQLAALDLDAVDTWSRLAALVRVQDGRAGAREVFANFAGRAASPAYELVSASLYDDAERRRRVEMFVAAHPDYGPGWYMLADEVSEARLGSQTIAEKRRERDSLARFLDGDERGTLARRFLDRTMLADWLDSARRRKRALDALLETQQVEPRAIFTRSGNDWSVYVQLPEPAVGFAYRLGESGAFVQAGPGFGTDPRTGRPMPNTNISIVPGAEPKAIEVTYLDLRGQEAGPFRIPFDPMAALVGQQKQALEMTKGSWIAFRDYNGLLVYTSHLVSYRCTIAKATYGLDSQPVDKAIELPPCDPKDPFSVPAPEKTYFKVPPATRSMTVRLQFRDGSIAESTIARR
ncbi:methyl-accepting chemotaxis protein [Prosthecomicrobium sp. N25]|uniref:methyl-accepting chemotaxis protein n=1 Tax=Prosthecomicrobium sp. N25 TaxID=3129254 RepID=UPI003077B4D7